MSFSPSKIPIRASLIFSTSLYTLRRFQQSYIADELRHLTEPPSTGVTIPGKVPAKPGDAFELRTNGEPLVKIDPPPSWVDPRKHPGTIGFRNSNPNVTAQPLLYESTDINTPIFGASSLWIPGKGRLKVPVENKVFAWFANAGPENISGFETIDFSTVEELKFRRGKNVAIKYSISGGWVDQELTDITPSS